MRKYIGKSENINFEKRLVEEKMAKDSDADGLSDAREEALGTDPYCKDTDEDGICDYEEVEIYHTDPLDPDTDKDGWLDGAEIEFGYNPLGTGKINDFFVGSPVNGFKPPALHIHRIVFYAIAALLVKAVLISVLVFVPFDAWMTQDIGAEQSRKIISLTNKLRQDRGIHPLRENAVLARAAQAKAEDMLVKQYFAHVSPEKKGLAHWLLSFKYDFAVAGENLAMGFSDAADVVNAWTKSRTHFENIIDPSFTEIGVAMSAGEYGGFETTFVSQLFGARKDPVNAKAKQTKSMQKNNAIPAQKKTANVSKSIPVKNTEVKQEKIERVETVQVQKAPASPVSPISPKQNLAPPIIVTPANNSVFAEGETQVRIFGPGFKELSLMLGSEPIQTLKNRGDGYFEGSLKIPEGKSELWAVSLPEQGNIQSSRIALIGDFSAPMLDTQRSKLEVAQPGEEGDRVVEVSAYLSPDTKTAEANFGNYRIDLVREMSDRNLWTGHAVIFQEEDEEIFNPVVLGTITAVDNAGSTATHDIVWENAKPVKPSVLNRYLFLKNNRSAMTSTVFGITSGFYKILIGLTVLALAVNIYIEMHKRHPHIVFSAAGLVILLVFLLAV